jgi:hypothetical protein
MAMISAPKPGKRKSRKRKDGRAKYSTLVKSADKWFSLYIRGRDKRCVQCGKTDRLTCGHLFSRVSHALRWDTMNAFGQCQGHNMLHEMDARPFTRWFIETNGQETYDALHKVFLSKVRRYTREELIEIAETYKKLVDARKQYSPADR